MRVHRSDEGGDGGVGASRQAGGGDPGAGGSRQAGGGDPGAGGLLLTVVGCAAAWTDVAGRASSAYLVELGDDAILLDMGQGSYGWLASMRDPASLAAVLISHAHPDHCIDLVPLRHYLKFGMPAPRTVDLHGPADLRARFDGLTAEVDFLSALPGDPLVPGRLRVGGFAIDVAPVLHVNESFAFRVSSASDPTRPGLVYSGDCGRADDLLPLIQPGDTLLVEASYGGGPIEPGPNHLNASEAARVAAEGRAGRLVLTHIMDGFDPDASRAAASRVFAGEVLAAAPGLRIAI